MWCLMLWEWAHTHQNPMSRHGSIGSLVLIGLLLATQNHRKGNDTGKHRWKPPGPAFLISRILLSTLTAQFIDHVYEEIVLLYFKYPQHCLCSDFFSLPVGVGVVKNAKYQGLGLWDSLQLPQKSFSCLLFLIIHPNLFFKLSLEFNLFCLQWICMLVWQDKSAGDAFISTLTLTRVYIYSLSLRFLLLLVR